MGSLDEVASYYSHMSLAVLIVNYNAGDWLQRSVKSALASLEVDAVFVVDNDSSDNSIELLRHTLVGVDESDSVKVEIVLNQENIGFGRANNQILNQLIEAGTEKVFDYVLLLNPDCELSPDVLPVMLNYFSNNKKLGMASCVIKDIDGSVQTTCRRKFPTPWTAFLRISQLQRLGFAKESDFDLGSRDLPEHMEKVEAISGAFMLVRVQAMKEVGVFDDAYFMHCEDLDWCKRFQLLNWDVGFIPEVSVIHEKGVSSRSRPVGVLWNLHSGMLRFFDKFYKNQSPLYLRVFVRIGIYASFLVRSGISILKGVTVKTGKKNNTKGKANKITGFNDG
jgi:GT2 family glycosyltransferase